MGKSSGTQMMPDPDYAAAYVLAQRVQNPEQRRVLEKAAARALEAEADANTLAEMKALVAYWKSMPEHITGSMATRQVEDVLAGGFAPRNAMTAK